MILSSNEAESNARNIGIYRYRKTPKLLQVNNILIVNLAVSDLLLCTVVSPVTLVEILFKRWTGPNVQIICQLTGMIPVCVTFVSTLTITGIAIDR